MSEARALTNTLGKGVATVVIAKWDQTLDEVRLPRVLDGSAALETDEPEAAGEQESPPDHYPEPVRIA